MSNPIPAWRRALDVDATVRYLARVATEEEADDFRAAASHSAPIRSRLLEVRTVLKEIQEMELTGVVRLRSDDSLRGEVAEAWLGICSQSLRSLIKVRAAETKLKLGDLLDTLKREAGSAPFVQMMVQGIGPRPTLSPALFRGGPEATDLTIEANLGEDGKLSVKIKANPEHAAEWEGRTVDVCMRVQVPVLVGTGTLRNGEAEFDIPGAGDILQRSPGPIGDEELTVLDPQAGLEVLPLNEDEDALEHPRLAEPPAIRDGKFSATVLVPKSLVGSLRLFAQLAPGQWQMVTEIQLHDGGSSYDVAFDWPDASELSGWPPISFRYELSK